MITKDQRDQIINLHCKYNLSNREIARELGLNRKTVNKVVNLCEEAARKGEEAFEDFIVSTPKYKSTNRSKRALTDEVCKILDEFIEKNCALEEEEGSEENRSSKMTAKDMYHELEKQGFKISYTSVANYVKKNSGAIIVTHSFAVQYAKKRQKKEAQKKKKKKNNRS